MQDKLSTDSLDSQISTQESTVEQLQANHRADAEEELSKLKNTKTAADNAIAEAKTQLSNANVIIGLDEDAGRSIVEQIQAIDAQVFDAAYKGEPDFASISTQAKPSLPFFGQNAKLPTGGQGPSVRTYASPINDVIDATNSLKKSLGGLTIERPNFKQCITSLGEAIAQVQKAQQATPTPTASATPTATATRTATPTPTKTPQPQHRKEKKGPKG